MRRIALILGITLGLTLPLAGCSSPPAGQAPLSPREQAEAVANDYAIAEVATEKAIKSGVLAPDVVTKIKATSQATTDAFLGYYDAAGLCWRNDAAAIVDAPGNPAGAHCDQTTLGKLLAAAKGLIANLGQLTAAYGFAPKPAS